jgi:hypothetical protein
MGKTNEENVKTGQQETNEPWKKPGSIRSSSEQGQPKPKASLCEDNKTA